MNLNNEIKLYILLLILLLSVFFWNLPALALSFNGSSTLSVKQTNIDKYNFLYPKGNILSLDTILMGEVFRSDFTGILNISKNHKNKIKIDNIFFELPFKKTKIEGGDFYLKYTHLSLDNLKIRGVNINHVPVKDKISLTTSFGRCKEKKETINEDINHNGLLDYGEDKNNNNQLDVSDGIFSQFIASTRFNLFISKNIDLSLNYFNIQDKYNSIANPKNIYSYSTVTPIKNNHFSLNGNISLYKKRVLNSHRLLFEYNFSQFDQNTKDNQKYIDDHAYKITLNNKIDKTNFDITYFLINPEYKTAGNLYLQNNQKGYKLHLFHQTKLFSMGIKGKFYKDNINTIPIKNTIIQPNLIFNLPHWPKLNLNHKLLYKKRIFLESLSPQKIENKEKTYSLGISHSIKSLSYFVNLQLSNYLNNSSYKSNYIPPEYQNFSFNINLNTCPQKSKKLSSNLFFSYNKFKNLDSRDFDQNYQANITTSYTLLPGKLLFSPLCEISRHYQKKDVLKYLRLKKRVFGGEWKYYFSTNQSLSFLYKNIKQKDLENEKESFKSDILSIETTIIF
ncbi:MAG: hypothetical protein QMD92_06505 [bacterium]|nr:hypothetical protein [bacterium]